jgi:hypothetical protein
MSLSIADDGIGFSKTQKQMAGVGISIMRYRVNLLGGEFEIEDGPSGGTIVSCTVPLGRGNLLEPIPSAGHLHLERPLEADPALPAPLWRT